MNAPETNPHKARMQAIMAALAQGDRRPFAEALADDFTWIMQGTTPWSGRYEGRQVVAEQLMRPLYAQFGSRYTNRAHRFIAEGKLVVVECRGQVTTKGGKPYHNAYCLVCRFGDDGLIQELTEYLDTQLVMEALEPPAR